MAYDIHVYDRITCPKCGGISKISTRHWEYDYIPCPKCAYRLENWIKSQPHRVVRFDKKAISYA